MIVSRTCGFRIGAKIERMTAVRMRATKRDELPGMKEGLAINVA